MEKFNRSRIILAGTKKYFDTDLPGKCVICGQDVFLSGSLIKIDPDDKHNLADKDLTKEMLSVARFICMDDAIFIVKSLASVQKISKDINDTKNTA